jgi:hypothetical protein
MRHLVNLRPAEITLLQLGSAADLRTLFKLTLQDLILKKVLKVEPSDSQTDTPVFSFSRGLQFDSYAAVPHEDVFLRIFKTDPDLRLDFPQLLKLARKNAYNINSYHKMIYPRPNLADAFKQSFFQRLLGSGFSISPMGIALRSEVAQEITATRALLQDLLQRNPSEADKIIAQLNGNVYLIGGIDEQLTRLIDERLMREPDRGSTDTSSSYTNTSDSSGCAGMMMWGGYGHFSNSFDDHSTEMGSDTTNFDSGFEGSSDGGSDSGGGDSGCSGCGGCGGGD